MSKYQENAEKPREFLASLQSKKLAPSQFKKFLRVWQYKVEQDR